MREAVNFLRSPHSLAFESDLHLAGYARPILMGDIILVKPTGNQLGLFGLPEVRYERT